MRFLFAAALLLMTNGASAATIPQAPYYPVLDEPGVLDPRAKKSLEELLVEHDRTTSEQIIVAIFRDAGPGDFDEFSRQVFRQWRVGQHGRDNGVLLSYDWAHRTSHIEVGYALDGSLPQPKAQAILKDVLRPELSAGNVTRGFDLAALGILEALESPLVQSGRAQQVLRAGGFTGGWNPVTVSWIAAAWGLWVAAGLGFALIALGLITAADAHFTAVGWYRANPYRHMKWWKSWIETLNRKGGATRSDPDLPAGGASGTW